MTLQFLNRIPPPEGDPDCVLDNGGPLGSGDTSLVVDANPADVTAKGAPFYFRVDDEWIKVGSVVGTTWSGLTRGIGVSSPASHIDGSGVYLVLLGEALEERLAGYAALDGAVFTGAVEVQDDFEVGGDASFSGDVEVDGELQVFADLYLSRSPALTGVNTGTSNILYVRSGTITFADDYTHGSWFDTQFDQTTYQGVSGHPASIDNLYSVYVAAPAIGADLTINNGAWSLGIGGDLRLLGMMEGTEITPPAAPPADGFRIYAKDTGGKTELLVLFNSGAAQQLAIEP